MSSPGGMRGGRAVLAFALCIVCTTPAPAQSPRNVVVNGERASEAELARLDRQACARIPDGNYWLAERSRLWGRAGDPRPQGRLGDCTAGTVRRNDAIFGRDHDDRDKPPMSKPSSRPFGDVQREEAVIGTSTLPRVPPDPETPDRP